MILIYYCLKLINLANFNVIFFVLTILFELSEWIL